MRNNHYCLACLAHVDAGKTTLSESILLNTGTIRQAGRVDHGTSFLDTDTEERERGITIFSKQALFDIEDKHYTLIDTPGHVDFSAEMERCLSILDFAVLIISAPDGVHGHDITLWRLLETYHVPSFIFVNKMDQEGASRERVMRELSERFGAGFVDFSDVDSEDGLTEIYESAALLDEELMDRYLEEGCLADTDLIELIRTRRLFPCCFGSALRNEGVDGLLKLIARFSIGQDYPEEFGAKIFKITRDQKGNRLTHVRITGGSIRPKEMIQVNQRGGGESAAEKLNRIMLYSGTKAEQLAEAEAGMTVAFEGLETTEIGATLGAESAEAHQLMVPLFTSNVSAIDDIDIHRLYKLLKELEEEIPEISVNYHESLGEISIKLMGEVQTDIIKAIVRERFDIRIEFSPASIVYKETIAAPVICAGHFEPLKHYAEAHFLLEPGERGSGIEIATALSEDVLPRHFQRLIMTNVGEKKHLGVLTGSELTDVRITLINARAHEKHTEGGDFRESVYRAIRQGLMKARSRGQAVLLEPYYNFELRVPEAGIGRAMTDLAMLAEHFDGPEINGGEASFMGHAAVSAMQGYGSEVMSYTGGFGQLSVSFGGYGPCLNTAEVVAARCYEPELDLDNQSGSVFCAHGAGYYVPWNEADAFFHLDIRAEEIKWGLLEGAAAKKYLRESTENVYDYSFVNETDSFQENDSRVNGRMAGKTTGKQDYMGAGIEQDKELEEIFNRSLGANRGRDGSNDGWQRKKRAGSAVMKTEKSTSAGKDHVEIKDPKKKFLLVDGYNIIFAWKELNELAQVNIDAARTELIDVMANYQGYTGVTLILVFDAYKVRGGKGSIEQYHNIYVVYTKEAQTADAYIEKTVHEIGHKNHVTVATSDGLQQTIVFGDGAARMSARELYEAVAAVNQDITENLGKRVNRLENRIQINE